MTTNLDQALDQNIRLLEEIFRVTENYKVALEEIKELKKAQQSALNSSSNEILSDMKTALDVKEQEISELKQLFKTAETQFHVADRIAKESNAKLAGMQKISHENEELKENLKEKTAQLSEKTMQLALVSTEAYETHCLLINALEKIKKLTIDEMMKSEKNSQVSDNNKIKVDNSLMTKMIENMKMMEQEVQMLKAKMKT
ncbi:CLUMA_CG013955, isoform A [Clunio marinus]|uniref:CLUMA_CG013955, isoform A n=1 Tax=Clunio marinus TaxID=568069 RepID=A0A1J1IKJ3_9DIPT|nr:CLUMA_CG013955, isoform A [Clunio marinus]